MKNFLRQFSIFKKIFGLIHTYKFLKIINKNNLQDYNFEQNKVITYFVLDKDKYSLISSKYDFRSYLIPQGSQNHKISFLKKMLLEGYFIDIGASYGEFSKVLEPLQKEIFCIEPNKYVFECLKDTFKNNKKVKLLNNAVSDKSVKLSFPSKIANSGNSTLINEKLKKIYSAYDYISKINVLNEVETIRLSEFIENNIPQDNAIINIKIDVEGFEELIIKDLLNYKYLNQNQIFIMFENNMKFKDQLKNIRNLLEKFKELNFKFYSIPSQMENMNDSMEKNIDLNNIDFNKDSEICLTNYRKLI